MEKRQALRYIKDRVGFIPHPILFNVLYEDGEDVPQELIDIECRYLQIEQTEPMLSVGPKLYEKLKEIGW